VFRRDSNGAVLAVAAATPISSSSSCAPAWEQQLTIWVARIEVKAREQSRRRADAVVADLVTRKGIARARLTGNGVGSLAPVQTNGTDEGRAKNHRVELVVQERRTSTGEPASLQVSMARYVTSVKTALAPAEAFGFMADVRRFAQWDPGVTRAVQVRGEGAGPNAAYELTVKSMGSTSVMRYEVKSFEAPRRVLLVAKTSVLESVDEVRVEPSSDGGSVVTYDAQLHLRGALAVFDPLLGLAFKRIGDRAAAGLASALEGSTVS